MFWLVGLTWLRLYLPLAATLPAFGCDSTCLWLRLYLPLASADLPQSPANLRAGEKLGFAGLGFRALLASGLSPLDLRVGAAFGPEMASAIRAALSEAAHTISATPARYMTYPKGGPVLPVTISRPVRSRGDAVLLDAGTLRSWGELMVPRHLWQALGRFSCWVEPALVASGSGSCGATPTGRTVCWTLPCLRLR